MALGSSATAFKRAWPFGLGGAALGGVGALVLTYLNEGEALTSNSLKVGGIGVLAGGLAGQALGMLYVNHRESLGGLMFTPLGAATGFTGGATISLVKNKHMDPKTIIRTGVLGSIVGTGIGAVADIGIKVANR